MHHLFVQYCAYFNGNEDYFECHEVLEEYWKEIAPKDRQHLLVGFILLATGMYHWRRGNTRGAERTLQKSLNILQQDGELFHYIEQEALIKDLENALAALAQGEAFRPFALAFCDVTFAVTVGQSMTALPLSDDLFLRDKHKLRDRTEIIAERLTKLAEKNSAQ